MIFIPFDDYNDKVGGPFTFMGNLKTYLDKHSYKYAKSIDKASGVFFPVAYRFEELDIIRNRGGQIIQRLDGVYYPSKAGAKYKELNNPIQKVYDNYSTYVVFQTQYSRRQCAQMLGEWKSEYKIIVNGVDLNRFYPSENKNLILGKKIRFITTGNMRDKTMIEPIVKALDRLRDHFEFELNIVGPVSEEIEEFTKRNYITLSGQVKNADVADILRASDMLLFSQLNPACPNTVLEAVATGLPVVGFASGSMKELLHFNSDLLAFVSDDVIQSYQQFDPVKLADKIKLAIENFQLYKQVSLLHQRDYDLETMGREYMALFKSLEDKQSSFFSRLKRFLK